MLTSVFPALSETFVVDHIVGMIHHGWEVSVAAWTVDSGLLEQLRNERNFAASVHPLKRNTASSRVNRIRAILRHLLPVFPQGMKSPWLRDIALTAEPLAALIQQLRPSIIHAHFGPNGISAALALRKAENLPLLVDFHGYDVTVIPKRHGWNFYRSMLLEARGVVHSSFVEHRVQHHIGIPTHRIGLGVDTRVFKAPQRKHRWPKHIRLLTVGRLIWQKGHHVALETLPLLHRALPQYTFSLHICGEGALKTFLQERAQMLGVRACVEITGGLPHARIADVMRKSDILLIPSIPTVDGAREAFCRVAVEGMASGLAVIGSATGGLAETIGTGGITVHPGNAAALATAIQQTITQSTPEQAACMAEQRAGEFSNADMWRKYDAITRQTADHG